MKTAHILRLKEGDVAPPFCAEVSEGHRLCLADFKGKYVILYFYPRDDTPGCTKQACGFRQSHAEFEKLGAVILGVSVDSARSHQKFIRKFGLPFLLVPDEDKRIVEAYGVWGEKSFLGCRYTGTHRITFLIGPDGRIMKIWPTVKPNKHGEEVLAALKALQDHAKSIVI